jgi:hypothetical protein
MFRNKIVVLQERAINLNKQFGYHLQFYNRTTTNLPYFRCHGSFYVKAFMLCWYGCRILQFENDARRRKEHTNAKLCV